MESVDNKMVLQSNSIVKESNALARAYLSPTPESVWDERIIAEIASRIRVDDMEFRDVQIAIEKLVGVSSFHEVAGRDLRCIHDAVLRLVGSKYVIYNGNGNYRAYSIFSYIEKEGGAIIAKFNQDMTEHLLQLRREFALRSLPEFQSLSGLHSQQIYRLLNSWRNAGSVDVPIKELHTITNASKTQIDNFKEFRIRVLETAEREINRKTSIQFRWEAIKEGRRVATVRFIFLGTEGDGDAEAPEAAPDRDELARQEENEYIIKFQRLSNACYEKCFVHSKGECRPNKGKKCTYCRTRGRMYARELVAQARESEEAAS